ncbi:nicotinate phosphoribosyltransferase [Dehalogenimonas sp. WBC-2]|nr:nicotinate phosphoribosyltransferase [Dehalogenimonas sp. WBC-2]
MAESSKGNAARWAKFSPSEEVLRGDSADVYFHRTIDILQKENLNPTTVMEVFPNGAGILCGVDETLALLDKVLPQDNREVWALTEGDAISPKEVALRIKAPYRSFGLYETAICGILASATGWATAARQCAEAAGKIPCISFGARHVHPYISGRMDYAAVTGGCKGCSSIEGARLAGIEPSGTMPHALIIVMGDTVKATLAFDKYIDRGVARVSLVDTFKDEAEESLRVAAALGDKLSAVRLDTPVERGRVTAELVKEVRARLDQAGHRQVGIFVSGGLTPDRIRYFIDKDAPVTGFGIGSYISGARPIDYTADIHEVDGQPIAKRGRIPGITQNTRLKQVL